MFNVITETLLSDYFNVERIVGKFVDRAATFAKLCKIWGVGTVQKDKLFALASSAAVEEILTYTDYTRFRRIKQYNEMTGNPQSFSKEEEVVIYIKGTAIKDCDRCMLVSDDETTLSSMQLALTAAAQQGDICALKVLGFLQCEGLCGFSDKDCGLKNLMKGAQWADVSCAVMTLFYSKEDVPSSIAMLNAAIKNMPFKSELTKLVKSRYGDVECVDKDVELTLKAFSMGRQDKVTYNAMYARWAFSPLVSIKDKEKVVFAEDKSVLTRACDLPLRLQYSHVDFERDSLDALPICREKDNEAIAIALEANDFRNSDVYKPLCICTPSEALGSLYVDALQKIFAQENVEIMDFSDISDQDAETEDGNLFLRYVNEDKNNVLILVLRGDVNERTLRLAKSFLDGEKRGKTALAQPPVRIDLSAILPICVCDKTNAKKLARHVDVVEVSSITATEKMGVATKLLDKKAQEKRLSGLSIDEEAMIALTALPISMIEKVLARFTLERAMNKTNKNVLTADAVKRWSVSRVKSNTFGFGGNYEID